MNTSSDAHLIEAYLKGDYKALDILVGRYLEPVYNFITRYSGDSSEAQDLTQETFLKAWKNIKKFDRTKSFKTWIFTIARNTTLDWFRKKKSVSLSLFDVEGDVSLADTLVDDELLPSDVFDNKKLHEIVQKAVAVLSPLYQTVLLLRYEEEFTFQEIATILNESIDTVKSRYRRALEQVKKTLPKNDLHQN